VNRGAGSALIALALAPACRKPPAATAERETIDHSEVHVLPRAANGRDYRIAVGLPDSYAASPDRRYPVVYVTDGYWDFKLLKSIIGGLVYDKFVPEVILVGIGYPGEAPDYGRLRRWDLTPVPDSPVEDAAKGPSGHAGEFLAVLEHQIIPFVEGRYRADPSHRVLGGSSLGGLFALYVLFTKPALFAAYIAPSPAVAFKDRWLLKAEEAFAQSGKPLAARLYMTAAEKEESWFGAAIQDLDERLRKRAYRGLAYEFHVVDGERHAGTKPESFNRGVRFAFAALMSVDGASADCKAVADALCRLSPEGCDNVRIAFAHGRIEPDGCRRAHEVTDGMQGLPLSMQATMATDAFTEVFGGQKTRKADHDTLLYLGAVEFDVKKGRSPDENIKHVLAAGPAACAPVLTRYREARVPAMKGILHQILVYLRGEDLGAGPDAWQPWCTDVIRQSFSPGGKVGR
jgi:uncharacterized protein